MEGSTFDDVALFYSAYSASFATSKLPDQNQFIEVSKVMSQITGKQLDLALIYATQAFTKASIPTMAKLIEMSNFSHDTLLYRLAETPRAYGKKARKLVKFCLQRGASPNQVDSSGKSLPEMLIQAEPADLNALLNCFCRAGFEPMLLPASLWPRIAHICKACEVDVAGRLFFSLAARISRSGKPVASSLSQGIFREVAKYR